MTEKQFTRKAYAIYEKGNPICMTLRDCDKRLNELYEENEQLKQSHKELGVAYDNLVKLGNDLEKENEQLKEEIKDLNDILARYEEKELKK